MTTAADLLLTNAEVHTLGPSEETYEAIAIRNGEIVRLGSAYDVEFLAGVETDVLDLDGRVVLPGFIDAHTHLPMVGQYLVHADLSGASSLEAAIDRLDTRAAQLDDPDEWILGYGYDESQWPEHRYPTRADLDAIAEDRRIVAFREDMHVASVNSRVLAEFEAEGPESGVETIDGTPTGVLFEEAIDPIYEAIEPDPEQMRALLVAAQSAANERGVTMVHDMVRNSRAPQVYRDLEASDELSVRVRLNYWIDHLESLVDVGLRTNHGSEMVQVGAIKTYTDGTIGGRTAKVSEPYADRPADRETGGRGQWVLTPEQLREYVLRAEEAGFQFAAHAIGDEAIDAVLDAYDACEAPGESRHRVEHVEMASEAAIERFGDAGVVASVQPNFLKWATDDGLYADRIDDRRSDTNRYRSLLDANAPLAFGSDCMPLDPLFGVHCAVNPPAGMESLDVTAALRAYTAGAAYAGFDEDRLGTIRVGSLADLTILDASPWDHEDAIDEISVAGTIVEGSIVYDAL
ncbi:MAG: amidohydrolase [Halobacteriota archaeon]